MLLGEPNRTQLDLNFSLLGIPIRVSPFFWLMALLFGQSFVQAGVPFALLWVAAVFISITIHELGHAMAFRRYGISSHIVLYHFGGLAVPNSYGSSWGSQRLTSGRQIFISFAGPLAQLMLAAFVILAFRLSGAMVLFEFADLVPNFIAQRLPQVAEAVGRFDELLGLGPDPNATVTNPYISAFGYMLIWPSIFWALLNLLPLYPLDGGQISREFFLLRNPHTGIQYSLILSVLTGAAVAVYGAMNDQPMMAIMLGMLAFSSYQTLQQYGGGGGYYR